LYVTNRLYNYEEYWRVNKINKLCEKCVSNDHDIISVDIFSVDHTTIAINQLNESGFFKAGSESSCIGVYFQKDNSGKCRIIHIDARSGYSNSTL